MNKRGYNKNNVKQSNIIRIVIFDNSVHGIKLRNTLIRDNHIIPCLHELNEVEFRRVLEVEPTKIMIMEVCTGASESNPKEKYLGMYLLAKYRQKLWDKNIKVVILTSQSLNNEDEIFSRALTEAQLSGLVILAMEKPLDAKKMSEIRLLCGLPPVGELKLAD